MATLSRQSKLLNLEVMKDSVFRYTMEFRYGDLPVNYSQADIEALPLVDVSNEDVVMTINPRICPITNDQIIYSTATTGITTSNAVGEVGLIRIEFPSADTALWDWETASYTLAVHDTPTDKMIIAHGKIRVHDILSEGD